MKKALIVFVKAPEPGRVKTRLQPDLAPEEIVEVYKSFVFEIMSKCARVRGVDRFMGCTPTKDNGFLKELAATYKMGSFNQQGNSLGERIFNAFTHCFKKGYHEAVLIGSDSPTIPVEYIRKAFQVLGKNDFVIGPCFDLGLYLIGVKKKKMPLIFRNIKIDTGRDVNIILKKLGSRCINFYMLPFWYDVDTIEDLEFMESHREYLKKSQGLKN